MGFKMKSENQKLKIVYLIEILTKHTDDDHCLNASQIIEKLAGYGIEAERKSIYNDITLLSDNKILDVECVPGRNGGFHVLNRKFELAELKMLVDAVQSCKFITNKQCSSLIKKISAFTSIYDEKKLSRSVYIYDRVRDTAKNAYYMIDSIHLAISDNKAIRFQYTDMTPSKVRTKKKNGAFYEVSPYALIWRDENYYLIAFHHESKTVRHYRVDRMENVEITETVRVGKDVFEKISLSKYSSNVFDMFGGEEYNVKFRCDNAFAGAMYDRFGDELRVDQYDDYFEFYAPVQISVRFFGWVFGFAGGLKILSPAPVVDAFKQQIEKTLKTV